MGTVLAAFLGWIDYKSDFWFTTTILDVIPSLMFDESGGAPWMESDWLWGKLVGPNTLLLGKIFAFFFIILFYILLIALMLLTAVVLLFFLVCMIPAGIVIVLTNDFPTPWADIIGGVAVAATFGLPAGVFLERLYRLSRPILAWVGEYSLASTIGLYAQMMGLQSEAARDYRVARNKLPNTKRRGVKMFKNMQAVSVLSQSELGAAQQRYALLATQDPTKENALVTLGRELATRLNLRQQVKTMTEWEAFYQSVTSRTAAYDEAVSSYFRVFGQLPADVPDEYVKRLHTEVFRERDQIEFEEEERLHRNDMARQRRKFSNTNQRVRSEAEIEEARARKDEARFKRARVKKEMQDIKKPKQENPRPLTHVERYAKSCEAAVGKGLALEKIRERASAKAERDFANNPDTLETVKDRIESWYEEEIQK